MVQQGKAVDTLCQILKEALADSQQWPVVVLQYRGGGHHELSIGVQLGQLIQALTNPAQACT